MKILEQLQNIQPDKVAFINDSECVKYGDLFSLFEKNKDQILALNASCVSISARSRMEFAKLLSILDGSVSRILFLPSDIDKDLFESYYEQAEINYEVFLDNNVLKFNLIKKPANSTNEDIKTQWIVPTSGTTSIPKLVVHTLKSLSKTVKKDPKIGEKYSWGLTFDIYRFSGIQVFLQSLLGGSKLIIPEANLSIGDSVGLFAKYGCNIISATPSFYRKLLMTKSSDELKLKRATLGGEIADDAILQALKVKFKDIKLTHIYASTELGVGFCVSDARAGFPLSYISDGYENIKVKIDQDGILCVKLGDKNSYIGKEIDYDEQGYMKTGDLVKVDGDRVYFLGRSSGSINVGGNKVLPEEIEQKILELSFVKAVRVYAKSSAITGALVCADVVVSENFDKSIAKTKILNHCKNCMPSFKVPVILKFIDEIGVTYSGKIKRD
ncbi:AMP-binding protein [Campylobacter suis]|uniref:Long-chain-fatty-acid--CoA ligase n=1 Tax=Campylobacter suis TaxID=2790657 RepID=A0ABN7KBZ8_9BACT|nr:class I adenylate-forming enzyme family protein [Campylobacter suis]CAD7288712.1 2-succinylbenzoate--CoA ligase [Campylobacter suis]